MTTWADPAAYDQATRPRAVDRWPAPMADAAFRGLAGDFVALAADDAEASREAILATLLATFGVMVGHGPCVRVRATDHRANLYMMVVGASGSAGAKGQSWDPIGDMLRQLLDAPQVVSGLGSGEGLIHAVRDPVMKLNKDGEEVVADPGVEDKRALVLEVELGRLLRVAERQGSTVLPLIRAAWDGHDLRTTTKANSERATRPHVGIVVHVTPDDLRRELREAELVNGTMNRFLPIMTRRTRIIADPSPLMGTAWETLCRRIEKVAAEAGRSGVMWRDDEAAALWLAAVPELERERPGLLASMAGRARAQVVRLSLIYALLDRAEAIGREHLESALAVWDYAERSARYLFEGRIGSSIAERILMTLDDIAPAGMSRTEISHLLNRNVPQAEITTALGILADQGLARMVKDMPGEQGGRPREIWFADGPER